MVQLTVVLLSEYVFCAPHFISLTEVYLTILHFFSIDTTQQAITCLNSTVKRPGRRQTRRSGVFVNFEQFTYIILEPHCWLWTSKLHVFLYYLYIIGMFSVGDTTWMSCFVEFGSWNNTSLSRRKSWIKQDGRKKQGKDWIFLSSTLECF